MQARFDGRWTGRAALVFLATLSAAGPFAVAQPPAPVQEVVVKARRPTVIDVTALCRERRQPPSPSAKTPKLVATRPVEGGVVAAGPVTLSLTFDQPMNCGWAVQYDTLEEICGGVGVWDMPERRTWSLGCTLPPGGAWTFHFDPLEGHGFATLAGRPAPPFTLNFSTAPAGAVAMSADESPRGARLLCPEHRPRGSGPRCRYASGEEREPSSPQRSP